MTLLVYIKDVSFKFELKNYTTICIAIYVQPTLLDDIKLSSIQDSNINMNNYKSVWRLLELHLPHFRSLETSRYPSTSFMLVSHYAYKFQFTLHSALMLRETCKCLLLITKHMTNDKKYIHIRR